MAVVDGVGLVAVFGGGVAESDVFAGVVGGQRDGAVSLFAAHGQRTVGVDGGDGPGFAVADRFTGRGDQCAVVAAGGDDVADVDVLAASDRCSVFAVEVSGVEPGCLHGAVDGVDVVVGRGDEGDCFAALVVFDPCRGDPLRGGRRCCRG